MITEEETFKADEDSEETMVQMLYTWGRGNEGQTGVQRISGREKQLENPWSLDPMLVEKEEEEGEGELYLRFRNTRACAN